MARRRERIEVYKDRFGKWRWRFKGNNGLILADSGEGYSGRTSCLRGLERIVGVPGALVYEHDAQDAVQGGTQRSSRGRGKVVGLNLLEPAGPASGATVPCTVRMVPVVETND